MSEKEEKDLEQELDESTVEMYDGLINAIKISIKRYKKYRHDRSLCHTEKLYVMEAFWKHCKKEKEDAMKYRDWLFDYYFSKFEFKDGEE